VVYEDDYESVEKIGAVSFISLFRASFVSHSSLFFVLQNLANIVVQNRMTGKLEEEKLQVYVRLGIRLLYKRATSRMEGGCGMFDCPPSRLYNTAYMHVGWF